MNSNVAYVHIICLGPQAGNSTGDAPDTDTTTPDYSDGYAIPEIPPPDNVPVANGTTLRCDSCNSMLFVGTAYCAGPTYGWDFHFDGEDDEL
ncbi:unnamed protein product [Penicillium pancosmium]